VKVHQKTKINPTIKVHSAIDKWISTSEAALCCDFDPYSSKPDVYRRLKFESSFQISNHAAGILFIESPSTIFFL